MEIEMVMAGDMINGGIGGVNVGGDANGGGIINGILYAKVMTDEWLEILVPKLLFILLLLSSLLKCIKPSLASKIFLIFLSVVFRL